MFEPEYDPCGLGAARPCVGCGFCCRKAPCLLGVGLHGSQPPCKELVWDKGRFWCGVMLKCSEETKELLKDDLAIGAGCCCALNSDRSLIAAGLDPREVRDEGRHRVPR